MKNKNQWSESKDAAMRNVFKPISYSSEMIQAVLAGRKTQTRRLKGLKLANQYGEFSKAEIVYDAEILDLEGDVVKLHGVSASFDDGEWVCRSPYQVGDVLWVREEYCQTISSEFKGAYLYRADHKGKNVSFKWKPSIHMPKTACRIWQKVKSVRIERVADISIEDCMGEGSPMLASENYHYDWFKNLWQSIHGQPSPVYKRENGKQVLSHYECYPFNESLAEKFRDELGLIKKYKGKYVALSPNPWVWVVEFENIFETPEGFLV
jgi:hypothetical protein